MTMLIDLLEALGDAEVIRAANRIPEPAQECFLNGDLQLSKIVVGEFNVGPIKLDPLSGENARLGVTGFLKLCVVCIARNGGNFKIDGVPIQVVPYDPMRSFEGYAVLLQERGHPEPLAILKLLRQTGKESLVAAAPSFNPQHHLQYFKPDLLPLVVKALVLVIATLMQGKKDLELCNEPLSRLVEKACRIEMVPA